MFSFMGWFCLVMVIPMVYLAIFGGYTYPNVPLVVALLLVSLPLSELIDQLIYSKSEGK